MIATLIKIFGYINYFIAVWKYFIITKLIDHKEKDKYVQLTQDLYEYKGLDEDDYKELINFSKPINSLRDYREKEKDKKHSLK